MSGGVSEQALALATLPAARIAPDVPPAKLTAKAETLLGPARAARVRAGVAALEAASAAAIAAVLAGRRDG